MTVIILVISVLPAYCKPITVQQTAIKFLMVMGAVVVASLIIYFGLSLYNRFFRNIKEDEILATPDNVKSAVKSFILRNRLK